MAELLTAPQAELLQQGQLVDDVPVLGHSVVLHPVDIDAGEVEGSAGRWDAEEFTGVNASIGPAHDHSVALSDDVMKGVGRRQPLDEHRGVHLEGAIVERTDNERFDLARMADLGDQDRIFRGQH